MVIWGIWLARNSTIFSDKAVSPEVTAAKSISILVAYPQKSKKPKVRNLSIVEIDKSRPWGFFDGGHRHAFKNLQQSTIHRNKSAFIPY